MSFLSQAKTKRLLSVHGWSGTVLGLLLYICLFTGAIVVFEDEIDIWAQGAITHRDDLGIRIDNDFRKAARTVNPSYYDEVLIFRQSDGQMQYRFQSLQPEPRQITRIVLDPATNKITDRWQGASTEQPPTPGAALRNFWVDLHVQLYLPNPYGLILVGVLGLMMMAAAISGILIHSHVVRDAFVAARNPARLVGARDLHVLAGTWGLPFAFILAFTGAFFGFVGNFGVPVMATAAFGGDQQRMIETLLGTPDKIDPTVAPMASLDYVLADARKRSGGTLSSIQIQNYNSVSSRIAVRVAAAPGQLSGSTLEFDGVTRAHLGESHLVGQVPSVGNSLLGLMGPLHFGDFAGVASKLVWTGMGLAMAFVTASGLLLWTKRRQDNPKWQRFRRWIMGVIWGLPFAMLVSALAFFLTLPAGDPDWWTPAGFLLGALTALRMGVPRLRLVTCALCLALPLVRHLTGGASWSEALIAGAWPVLLIDLLFLIAGLVLLRQHKQHSQQNLRTMIQEPAE